MSEIRITVDDSVLCLLGDSPARAERRARELMVLELYRRHAVSAGRAAEILGLDELAFIRWSGSLGIPFIDFPPEELRQELANLQQS
jgi:predicted HTH domain antitoxin